MNNTLFSKKVDLRSRKSMIDFLRNHFRYYTMNSWNRSTSYANNVKIYNLSLPSDIENKAYALCMSEIHNNPVPFMIESLINEFYFDTGYTVGFNGRSSGYIVMYEAICENNVLKVYPGKSIDEDDDFEDWHIDDLKERTKLVKRFDKLCDDIRLALIDICKEYDINEKTICTEQKILCAEPKGDELI